ncbi:amidohydrolase [Anaerovorax odorimutans]|uniref:amidohydrolase n=1 Tax=Anaerovorax odorimutans TaxID=109327 RepID=UPI00040ED722|nr:amidohydrolase [Anaerovorax odorimutans]
MKADIILKSKNIFTGLDDYPVSGAVAIKNNKIVAIMSENEIKNLNVDKIIDYGDKLIMAGFIDAHVHYFMGAISYSDYMCTEIAQGTSEEDCIKIMKKFAEKHPNVKRLLGIGWFPANWNDAPLPSKKSLDEAFPDKAVYLLSADVHTFWMNTKALEESGIKPDMKIRSGSVGTYENGELNGLLFEPDAFEPAMAKVQEFDKEIMKKINKDFFKHIAASGVTCISDMSADQYDEVSYNKYLAVKEMEESGDMTCRFHIYTHLDGYTDFSKAKLLQQEFYSEKLRVNGVKGFLDGVTSTFTGLMLEPYSDKPETTGVGVPNVPKKEMEKFIIAANAAGLPVRLHCIADGSVRMALDMYEASIKANGKHGLANTVEHIENIHPDDIPRFKELDVIPSMQPYHLILDFNEKISRIGKERCRWEWPHRSLLDNGAGLAFGTDYPVVDFNPFPSIYAAVTRMDDNGVPTGINPEETITLSEALKAYTVGAAKAYGRDDIGVLQEGKLADIIVVDKNLFNIAAEEIKDCHVLMTMFDGKVIYEK